MRRYSCSDEILLLLFATSNTPMSAQHTCHLQNSHSINLINIAFFKLCVQLPHCRIYTHNSIEIVTLCIQSGPCMGRIECSQYWQICNTCMPTWMVRLMHNKSRNPGSSRLAGNFITRNTGLEIQTMPWYLKSEVTCKVLGRIADRHSHAKLADLQLLLDHVTQQIWSKQEKYHARIPPAVTITTAIRSSLSNNNHGHQPPCQVDRACASLNIVYGSME